MKKILLTSIAISLAFSLSACSKKIEPNNYYCLGFDGFNLSNTARAAAEEVNKASNNGNLEPSNIVNFQSKCQELKLGAYNEEFKELSNKSLKCAFAANTAECSKPYNTRIKELYEQWEKEAGIK